MEAQLVESGKHLKELRRALCAKGALDAITVFKIGGEWFCIDGHHRLEAYRQAGGRRTHIPVRVFQGSLAEAFSYSIAANAPDKLNLSRDDKYESAWRMVLLGVYTVRQINASTTVSNGTIQNMTEAAKTVGQQWPLSPVEDFSWSQVKHLLRSGMPKENTMWQEAKVKEWAKKLARSFNGVPNKHPKLFAQALLLYDRGTAQSIAYEIQRQTESEQSDF
jgi:ParB-like chromosome segregation protein Spo0J